MEKRYDVVTIGLQVIDLVITGVDEGIMGRELTRVDSMDLLLGGDALNEAIVLSRLGARTGIMGVVGYDSLGDQLLNELGKYPIDVLNRREDVITSISIVLIDKNGERHFLNQPKGNNNNALAYRHVDEEAVKGARVLSLAGSLLLPSLDGEDTLRLLSLAKENGTITSVDFRLGGNRYDPEMIRREIALCDYLIPSEIEARYLTGEDTPQKMAAKLRSFGAGHVVVKLGSEGCYISSDGIEKMIPAFPARCIDTTGAGDNFAGAFLYGVSQGWEFERCAMFGNAAGSIAVEHTGANQAVRSINQVFDRMKTR